MTCAVHHCCGCVGVDGCHPSVASHGGGHAGAGLDSVCDWDSLQERHVHRDITDATSPVVHMTFQSDQIDGTCVMLSN